ncbi:MAG: DUF4180 domain-containing protein [Pseudohongiellaceae bacterium]|nr:DUF4180 domain-containing protein [Pseudohongiellaceae bacterium]
MSLRAKDHSISLHCIDDAMSLIGSGMDGCLFTPDDIASDFFDLKNGLAGEVFQKLVNYRFPVAFIIPSDHPYGDRVTELIRDHKQHPVIRFFQSEEDGIDWLKQQSNS